MEQREQIVKYLKEKKMCWSRNTLTSTTSRLKHLDENSSPQELYKKLLAKGYNSYYIKTVFINVCSFMDWSSKEQGSSPFKKFMDKNPQLFRNVYEDKYATITFEEFLNEYREATGEFKDVLALLGTAGIRLCELYTFDGTHVLGKGGKRRAVFSAFPINHNKFTLSESQIRRRLRHNPHSYRKLCADTLLRNGFDIKTIQVVLGHSSINSTQRYLRPMNEDNIKLKLERIYK